MVELAIFGTFVLIGLALIVQSGASHLHAQRTAQEAFRNALKAAYETRAYGDPRFDEVTIKKRPTCPRCLTWPDPSMPGCPVDPTCTFSPDNTGQVLLVRDRHVPDPTHPFATGTFLPTASGASVVWGTDSAEFEPSDIVTNADVPKLITQVNDTAFRLKTARFLTYAYPYTPALAQLLCKFDAVYGNVLVDFFDAAGVDLNDDGDDKDVTVDFKTCKAGIATIRTNGESPARALVKIIDGCQGDVIDPRGCADTCKKAGLQGLPIPAYCGALPPKNKPQGLDLGTFNRTLTADDRLQRQEDTFSTRAHTTIHETATLERKLWTNPNVTPDYPLKTGNDGSPYIDATTSVSRERDHQWTTRW